MIERLEWSKEIDKIVVATTVSPLDDPIIRLVRELKIPCFRGSEEDLLGRYYRAALAFGADPVVRLTSDCPLIDPVVTDRVLRQFIDAEGRYDAVNLAGNFPDGLDTSVYSFEALARAWREAELPSEREHVGPYIINHPEIFRSGEVFWQGKHSHLRWTVDEPRDLEVVRAIYEFLYQEGEVFLSDDIIALLEEHPELLEINAGIVRNEGYLVSLDKDKEWLTSHQKDGIQ
jgi:spore coat polysaccharide biosynthesis protein SpsF